MIRHLGTIFAALALPAVLFAGTAAADLKLPRVSPKASVSQDIGLTTITVAYCRPGVKSRTIWGELVPYDKPWRTGANEANAFTTTDEIQLGGQKLAAGTYALLTIPGKDVWTVVLNSGTDLWGTTGYKPEKDVLRVKVKPQAAEHEEWMRFSFEDLTNSSANLVLQWEKLRLAIPITVDVNTRALADSRAAITSAETDTWRVPYQAANYCFTSEVSLDEGRKWLDKSLAVQRNYTNLTLLAKWQMKEGKKKEAIATAQSAIAAGKASKEKVETAPTEKLLADWTAMK